MSRLHAFLRPIVAIVCAGATGAASAIDYSGIFFFGDSLSDAGNLAVLIGADPGQTITGNSYIPGRPYASGQFTNGDVWAKTFSAALGLAPSAQPALLGGGNFAFGGARVATDGPGLPPSLTAQEASFLTAGGGSAPGSALYVIAGGGNDARDVFAAAAGAADPTAVIAGGASAFARDTGILVDRLQAAGAQHIVVWDVPNVGLAPAVTTLGPSASFLGALVSQSMNAALAARLGGEAGVTVFDVFGLQGRIVADPASFGLVNVADACGATPGCNPATALYWDGIHPTSGGHAILAQAMIAAVPEPEQYVLLLAGLLLVAVRKSRRLAAGVAAAAVAIPTLAADAQPPADPAKPVTTVRVGGHPSDSQFRDANQKAIARYREAVASCRTRPSAERSACVRGAKADLKTAQRDAKATHDAARRRKPE